MARRRRRSSASAPPALYIIILFLVGYIVLDKGWDKRFMQMAARWDASGGYATTQPARYPAPPQHNGQQYPAYGYLPNSPSYQDGGY